MHIVNKPLPDKSFLYVAGDSFCGYSTNEDNHWPAILAKKLDLNLIVSSYPGLSWWNNRLDLLEYIKTDYFKNTQYFIINHTYKDRIVSKNKNLVNYEKSKDIDLAKEMYYKHIYDPDLQNWITDNWYKELGLILKGKQVIHLIGFPDSLESLQLWNGLKCVTPLSLESAKEVNNDMSKLINDLRPNHFSVENNRKLADTIYENMIRYFVNGTGPDTFKFYI